jgi:hypothetical protein
MFPCLLLSTALIGQTAAPADTGAAPAPSPPADRWLLMKSLQGTWPGWLLDANRLSLSGWTDISYNASSDRHVNLPMGFNYRANEPAVQQNWVRFERSVATSGTTEPTFGFRTSWILPGIDYRFTLARGIFDGQLTANDGGPNIYGVDPIEFYTELYFPTVAQGLDIKVGRFFAQYGVESNEAISNALESHASTFIYNPFTHTGILATLKLTPAWTAVAGVTLGSDVFVDPADRPTFIGNVKRAPPGGRDIVQFSVIVGPGRFEPERNFNNPEVFDLIYTRQLNARLSYTLEGLYEFQTNVPNIGTATSLGVVNYLTRTFTPRLSGTTRLEFFDDFQGQRTGFEGLYTTITAGLSFKPYKSVIFRPELRYDYNGESRPFENKHGLFTATADLILRW